MERRTTNDEWWTANKRRTANERRMENERQMANEATSAAKGRTINTSKACRMLCLSLHHHSHLPGLTLILITTRTGNQGQWRRDHWRLLWWCWRPWHLGLREWRLIRTVVSQMNSNPSSPPETTFSSRFPPFPCFRFYGVTNIGIKCSPLPIFPLWTKRKTRWGCLDSNVALLFAS